MSITIKLIVMRFFDREQEFENLGKLRSILRSSILGNRSQITKNRKDNSLIHPTNLIKHFTPSNMTVEHDWQILVVLYMKPTLLSAEANATTLVISSLKDYSQVNLLPIRRKSAHQKVSTDSSSSSHLSLHNKFTFVTVLIASPDIGILRHSEFLYHNHYFLLLDLYISI